MSPIKRSQLHPSTDRQSGLTTSLLILDSSLLVLDNCLALLLARRSLLLGRCVSILNTLSLAFLRRGLRCSLALSRSNDRATGLDVVDIVLELVLELLDDLTAGVDVAAARDGSLLLKGSAGVYGMSYEEAGLLC